MEINQELEEKIKSLNKKLFENGDGQNMVDHQGLGLEGCEQFTKNLTYGKL
jgi:hypothetical protein